MELYIVSTPIGNLSDITARATETLKFCDLILAEDVRTSAKLFSYLGFKKPCLSYHKFNEREMSSKLADLFEKHKKIALISDAGTPAICDPGSIIINQARKLGAKIFAVPGCCAVAAAVSLSGEHEPQFAFLGFFPRQLKEQKELLNKIEKSGFMHFVFYESPNRILKTFEILKTLSIKEIRVFNDLTKRFEREYVGTLSEVSKMLAKNPNVTLGEYAVSFSILPQENKKEQTCAAGLLADYVVKNNVSIKDAVLALAEQGINKNALKQGAIILKEKFAND